MVFSSVVVSPYASGAALHRRYFPKGYTGALLLPHLFLMPLVMAEKRREWKRHESSDLKL
jgi:hypothetical protein